MIISSLVSAASRFIRLLAILLLLTPSVAFADFCSVDNFGNITSCFPSADMCQQWARTSQGRCVLRSSGGAPQGGTGPSSGNPDWLQGLGNMARQRSQELQQGRDATPGWIAPLSPSSNYLTPALVNMLTSQLNNMLEMSQGRDFKPWKSSSANGFMAVEVGAKNQFGDICREFVVTLDYSSERKGIKGNACRSGGTWRILGSVPLEFRDGKIVEDNVQTTTGVENMKSGSRCELVADCPGDLVCDRGRCVEQKKSGDPCRYSAECSGSLVCDSGTCVSHTSKPSQVSETDVRTRQPLVPDKGLEHKSLGMTPAEALGKSMVGKWKLDCLAANGTETEYSLQGDTIRGVLRNIKGVIIENYSVEKSSVNYLGSKGELHRFSYISSRTYNDLNNSHALIVETEFNRRRTLSSTRISDGEVLIRDGVFVGNNKATPYYVRCSN